LTSGDASEDQLIASGLVREFPELATIYEQLLLEAARDNEDFSVYSLWADGVMPFIVWPAMEGHDAERLSTFFRLMEPWAERTDPYIRNFVAVEVCEVILSNRYWYEFSWPLLGPSLKESCAKLFEYQRSLQPKNNGG
jgi:hypothetical protein